MSSPFVALISRLLRNSDIPPKRRIDDAADGSERIEIQSDIAIDLVRSYVVDDLVVGRRHIFSTAGHEARRRCDVVYGDRIFRHPIGNKILIHFIRVIRPLRMAHEQDLAGRDLRMNLIKDRIEIEVTHRCPKSLRN